MNTGVVEGVGEREYGMGLAGEGTLFTKLREVLD